MKMGAWFSKGQFIERTLVHRVILLFCVKTTFRSQRYYTLLSGEINIQFILAICAFCISHHMICFESQPKTVTTCNLIGIEYQVSSNLYRIRIYIVSTSTSCPFYEMVNGYIHYCKSYNESKITKKCWITFRFVVG